jgi:threonine/homoserine/homoserine lactone efflux protein
MSVELLSTFVLASALLSLAPGPDNIFVLTQSALHGSKAGILITLGLCTGLLMHTTLVAFGVAAIFMVSVTAFTVLKLLGAAYLLYLAVLAFRASARALTSARSPALSPRQLYLRGILMNLSNPKVAIFFLAFLPQFARAEAGSMQMQLLVLGVLFIVIALLVFSLIALLAGHLASWFQGSQRANILLNRAAGLVFVGLAARLALSSR